MSYKIPLIARFTFEGPDRRGLIATITGFFFKENCNILDIDQRILEKTLIMNTLVDLSEMRREWDLFLRDLSQVVKDLGMRLRCERVGDRRHKKIALLVTKESECPEAILKACKDKKISGHVEVMIGNQPELGALAKKFKVPFHFVGSEKKKEHEQKVLRILDEHQVDLIVLARYMQILSPEFCFRYEGHIINIHPSLLPAFPGPRSYHQAYNKGVEIVGVTAHFVTTDLDEGPIICQSAFRINKLKEDVGHYIKKGRQHEAATLMRAVKLFCNDSLCLRRGKVIMSRKEHVLTKITKGYYC